MQGLVGAGCDSLVATVRVSESRAARREHCDEAYKKETTVLHAKSSCFGLNQASCREILNTLPARAITVHPASTQEW